MIKKIALALCLLGPALSNGMCGQRPMGARITGGHTATPHSWPWQLSLRKEGTHICGATLINHEWAVTAAHCLKDKKAQYSIMAGGHHRRNKDNRGTIIPVSKLVSHVGYDQRRHPDIAVVKLAKPVKFSTTIAPACLPVQGDVVTPGLNCYISGWGVIDRGRLPKELQEARVPVISHQQCRKRHSVNERDMICIGGAGSSMCLGDSGGPLVCEEGNKWVLCGAASFVWGAECPVQKYSVYARVSSQIDWINANIREQPVSTSKPVISFSPSTEPAASCLDKRSNCRRFLGFCKRIQAIADQCKKSCNLC